jgi:hypothetical protein
MKRLLAIIIIGLGVSLSNLFSLQETYPTDKTFVNGGRTISCRYVSHETNTDANGMWVNTETKCPQSPDRCYTRTNNVGSVTFDFNVPLIGNPLSNNTLIHVWLSEPHPTDSVVIDHIIDAYFHVNP